MIYFIPEWDKHFETAKSRTFKRCANVCMPNKQDGLGFTRIMSLNDGAAIFGIWCLILQACSRQSAPRQGYLTDTGVSSGCPWTISDLAMRWRRPESEIARAVEVLTSQGIGWLGVYESTDTTRIPQGYHKDTLVPLELNRLDRTRLDSTSCDQTSRGGIVDINPDAPASDPADVFAPQPMPVPTAPRKSFLDWVASGHPRVQLGSESAQLWRALWDQYTTCNGELVENRDEIWEAMYQALEKQLEQKRFKIWPTQAQEWLMSNFPLPTQDKP